MIPIYKCVLCGSKLISRLYKTHDHHSTNIPGEYEVWRCSECGLFFINPMLEQSELDECYGNDYYAYKDYPTMKDKRGIVRRMISRIMSGFSYYHPQLNKGATVLDVGCGSGEWLFQMKECGYQTKGCEISSSAATLGQAITGIEIFPGSLVDCKFENESFDFIRANHSFEHINNPRETLVSMYKLLKPGGEICIGVPNTRGLWSRIFKERWFYLGAPIHVYNYSDNNLKVMMEQVGFLVKRIRYCGNYQGLLGSILIAVTGASEFNYLSGIFRRLLMALCCPFVFVANMLEMGDCIEVVATKK